MNKYMLLLLLAFNNYFLKLLLFGQYLLIFVI